MSALPQINTGIYGLSIDTAKGLASVHVSVMEDDVSRPMLLSDSSVNHIVFRVGDIVYTVDEVPQLSNVDEAMGIWETTVQIPLAILSRSGYLTVDDMSFGGNEQVIVEPTTSPLNLASYWDDAVGAGMDYSSVESLSGSLSDDLSRVEIQGQLRDDSLRGYDIADLPYPWLGLDYITVGSAALTDFEASSGKTLDSLAVSHVGVGDETGVSPKFVEVGDQAYLFFDANASGLIVKDPATGIDYTTTLLGLSSGELPDSTLVNQSSNPLGNPARGFLEPVPAEAYGHVLEISGIDFTQNVFLLTPDGDIYDVGATDTVMTSNSAFISIPSNAPAGLQIYTASSDMGEMSITTQQIEYTIGDSLLNAQNATDPADLLAYGDFRHLWVSSPQSLTDLTFAYNDGQPGEPVLLIDSMLGDSGRLVFDSSRPIIVTDPDNVDVSSTVMGWPSDSPLNLTDSKLSLGGTGQYSDVPTDAAGQRLYIEYSDSYSYSSGLTGFAVLVDADGTPVQYIDLGTASVSANTGGSWLDIPVGASGYKLYSAISGTSPTTAGDSVSSPELTFEIVDAGPLDLTQIASEDAPEVFTLSSRSLNTTSLNMDELHLEYVDPNAISAPFVVSDGTSGYDLYFQAGQALKITDQDDNDVTSMIVSGASGDSTSGWLVTDDGTGTLTSMDLTTAAVSDLPASAYGSTFTFSSSGMSDYGAVALVNGDGQVIQLSRIDSAMSASFAVPSSEAGIKVYTVLSNSADQSNGGPTQFEVTYEAGASLLEGVKIAAGENPFALQGYGISDPTHVTGSEINVSIEYTDGQSGNAFVMPFSTYGSSSGGGYTLLFDSTRPIRLVDDSGNDVTTQYITASADYTVDTTNGGIIFNEEYVKDQGGDWILGGAAATSLSVSIPTDAVTEGRLVVGLDNSSATTQDGALIFLVDDAGNIVDYETIGMYAANYEAAFNLPSDATGYRIITMSNWSSNQGAQVPTLTYSTETGGVLNTSILSMEDLAADNPLLATVLIDANTDGDNNPNTYNSTGLAGGEDNPDLTFVSVAAESVEGQIDAQFALEDGLGLTDSAYATIVNWMYVNHEGQYSSGTAPVENWAQATNAWGSLYDMSLNTIQLTQSDFSELFFDPVEFIANSGTEYATDLWGPATRYELDFREMPESAGGANGEGITLNLRASSTQVGDVLLQPGYALLGDDGIQYELPTPTVDTVWTSVFLTRGDDRVYIAGDEPVYVLWSPGNDVIDYALRDNDLWDAPGSSLFDGYAYAYFSDGANGGLDYDYSSGVLEVDAGALGLTRVNNVTEIWDTAYDDTFVGSDGSETFKTIYGGLDTVTGGAGEDKFEIRYYEDRAARIDDGPRYADIQGMIITDYESGEMISLQSMGFTAAVDGGDVTGGVSAVYDDVNNVTLISVSNGAVELQNLVTLSGEFEIDALEYLAQGSLEVGEPNGSMLLYMIDPNLEPIPTITLLGPSNTLTESVFNGFDYLDLRSLITRDGDGDGVAGELTYELLSDIGLINFSGEDGGGSFDISGFEGFIVAGSATSQLDDLSTVDVNEANAILIEGAASANDVVIVADGAGLSIDLGSDTGSTSDVLSFVSTDAAVTIDLNQQDADGWVRFTTVDGASEVRSADAIIGSDADDTITGYTDRDNFLSGGAGGDTLIGGSGNDFLHGSYGNDTLIGGAGDDILWDLGFNDGDKYVDGGAGRDIFVVRGQANYVDLDGNGTDELTVGEAYDQAVHIRNLELAGDAMKRGGLKTDAYTDRVVFALSSSAIATLAAMDSSIEWPLDTTDTAQYLKLRELVSLDIQDISAEAGYTETGKAWELSASINYHDGTSEQSVTLGRTTFTVEQPVQIDENGVGDTIAYKVLDQADFMQTIHEAVLEQELYEDNALDLADQAVSGGLDSLQGSAAQGIDNYVHLTVGLYKEDAQLVELDPGAPPILLPVIVNGQEIATRFQVVQADEKIVGGRAGDSYEFVQTEFTDDLGQVLQEQDFGQDMIVERGRRGADTTDDANRDKLEFADEVSGSGLSILDLLDGDLGLLRTEIGREGDGRSLDVTYTGDKLNDVDVGVYKQYYEYSDSFRVEDLQLLDGEGTVTRYDLGVVDSDGNLSTSDGRDAVLLGRDNTSDVFTIVKGSAADQLIEIILDDFESQLDSVAIEGFGSIVTAPADLVTPEALNETVSVDVTNGPDRRVQMDSGTTDNTDDDVLLDFYFTATIPTVDEFEVATVTLTTA